MCTSSSYPPPETETAAPPPEPIKNASTLAINKAAKKRKQKRIDSRPLLDTLRIPLNTPE